MHLIVDLFWQVTIFENQFIEEEEVIAFLPCLVLETSYLLQEYSPEIYEILPKLFQSALVKAKIEVREDGSEFITKLFGHDPVGINIAASEYIMEINNWNNLEAFNTEFDKLNTNIGEDMRTRGVLYSARLSQKRSNYLSLIGCCKGNR